MESTFANFSITGIFYNSKNYKFRSCLNIRRINNNSDQPDLMVIMMNPGSSKPISDIYDVETPAIPDMTQSRIIEIMNRCDFNYARVLNLSDIREPKSAVFYKMIAKLEEENIPHSIFCDERKEDFITYFVHNIPVIFAWGVHSKLAGLSKKAIDTIAPENIFGYHKTNGIHCNTYYHPLRRSLAMQTEWINKVSLLIKNKSAAQSNISNLLSNV